MVVLISSCLKNYEMNLENGEKILSITSELDPDEEVKVLVALPKEANLYGNYHTPSDVDVVLFEDGKYFDKLIFHSNDSLHGLYKSEKAVSAGKDYDIKASYKDFKSASASQKIPEYPQIEEVSFNKNFLKLNTEDTVSVTIELGKDSLLQQRYFSVQNFLAVRWGSVDSHQVGNPIIIRDSTLLVTTFDKSGGFNDYRRKWINEISNSGEINYRIALKNTDLWKSENIISLQLIIILEEITKDGYDYRVSYRKRNNDNFGEPMIVYSNIYNGIGIFSAKVTVQRIIKIF